MHKLTPTLLLLTLLACQSPERTTHTPPSEAVPDNTPQAENTFSIPDKTSAYMDSLRKAQAAQSQYPPAGYEGLDSALYATTIALRQQWSGVPYFTDQEDRYFYVTRGKAWGWVQANNRVVLEVEQQRIGQPNLLLPGCVEVQKANGRVAFFHWASRSWSREYHSILPQGGGAVGLTPEGMESITRSDTAFAYARLDRPIHPQLTAAQINLEPQVSDQWVWHLRKELAGNSRAIFLPPSFFYRLHPNLQEVTEIEVPNNPYPPVDAFYAIQEYETRVEEASTTSSGLWALISRFYYLGIGTRGFVNETYTLGTMDTTGPQARRGVIIHEDDGANIPCDEFSYQWLADTLLEVRQTGKYEHEIYMERPLYSYFQIQPDGQVVALTTTRHFAQSKYTRLQPYHFEGCFSEYLRQNPEGNYRISEHLSLADLDAMRNEIFAEYGYRFQSERWRTYFEAFDWYEAKHDNVDDQLTETDRHNIQVILDLKARMEGNEQDFTHPEVIRFVFPG